jgi:hypothetical protein
MEMEKCVVRILLRHYWKQNYKAAAAAKKKKYKYIYDVESEVAVNERTA